MDLENDCLGALDLVVASIHSAFNQDRQQMTARILRALENPYVDILGHPTGRLILRREPYPVDVEAVLDAAARHGVAVEINCQLDRLDLNEVHARLARERGVPIVISSDAHSTAALGWTRWGVLVARRAWLEPQHVLNTRPFEEFKARLRRNRR
jgi:DNA polymerase (family 10)